MTDVVEQRLILASGSATRAQLLRNAGVRIEIMAPGVDERAVKQSGRPDQIATSLAEAKALSVSKRHTGLVIGADQTLDLDGQLMNKPADLRDAREQLLALRGRRHWLRAAVCVASDGVVLWRVLDSAALTVRTFSDSFLESYLAREGDAILQCVGCYRLEGEGVQLFDRIEGDFFTVLGLPLTPLLAFLREQGALTP